MACSAIGAALPSPADILDDAYAGEAAIAAKAILQKAITWCTMDAAGPSLGLLRMALLDLASVLLSEGALPGALACLQAAATAGGCREALLQGPQALGAVTVTAVPTWATQLLQGVPTFSTGKLACMYHKPDSVCLAVINISRHSGLVNCHKVMQCAAACLTLQATP